VNARFLVDASGRRGCLSGKRRRLAPPLLVALASFDHGWIGPETIVEAGDDCWYWGMMRPGGGNVVGAFIDPARRSANPEQLVREAFASSKLLKGVVVGASQFYSAAPTLADDLIGNNWMRVGDAALTFDPVSGQGSVAALGGGSVASTVIHTILTNPEDILGACEFYRRWISDGAAMHLRHMGAYYAEQAMVCPTPFWQKRAIVPEIPTTPLILPQPHERVGLPPNARIVPIPTLEGEFICRRSGVLIADSAQPMVYISGTPVVELLPLLSDYPTALALLDRLIHAYGQHGRTLFNGMLTSQITQAASLTNTASLLKILR
jgi:hypothetical protein